MEEHRTSLSAGLAIRRILLEAPGVTEITNRIYPVVTDDAPLPYILYRRAAMEQVPVKGSAPGADSVQIEIVCFSQTYAESIALAENVRYALDGRSFRGEGLVLRGCVLSDSEEGYEGDAIAQRLIFTMRI